MKIAIVSLFLFSCTQPCVVPDAGVDAGVDAPAALPEITGSSRLVTWTCLSDDHSACPWGNSTANQAVAWPARFEPSSRRLGYQTDAPVYLQAASLRVTIVSGKASVYAGKPEQSEKFSAITSLHDGESAVVGVSPGMVLSIEGSGDAFDYEVRWLQ